MANDNVKIKLELTQEELILVNNALNEIVNGPDAIDEWEFQTRTGATRPEAQVLLSKLSMAIKSP